MASPVNYTSRIIMIHDYDGIQKRYLPPIEFDDDCIITKHLTDDQKIAIRSQQVTKEDVHDFAYHFNSKNCLQHMVDNLKENEKNGMLALRAWHEKLITDDQFFTACYVYSAIDQMFINKNRYEVRYDPLDCAITEHELSLKPECFTELLSELPISAHSIYDENNKNLCLVKYFFGTKTFLSTLSEKLKNEPDSEKNYLVIGLPLGPVSNWSPLYGRLEMVTPYLHRVDILENSAKMPLPGIEVPKLLVVPSYSMYRIWFEFFKNDIGLNFQPLLGKLSKQNIMECLENKMRLGSLNIPGAFVPSKADNHLSGRYFFCVHDIYHMIRMLLTPLSHFIGMLKVCKILSKLKITQPQFTSSIEAIRWKIMDGENFRQEEGTCERFGAIFNEQKQWTKEIKKRVLQDMAVNKSEWKQETNLSIKEHLYPEERSIYLRLRQKIKEDKLL